MSHWQNICFLATHRVFRCKVVLNKFPQGWQVYTCRVTLSTEYKGHVQHQWSHLLKSLIFAWDVFGWTSWHAQRLVNCYWNCWDAEVWHQPSAAPTTYFQRQTLYWRSSSVLIWSIIMWLASQQEKACRGHVVIIYPQWRAHTHTHTHTHRLANNKCCNPSDSSL